MMILVPRTLLCLPIISTCFHASPTERVLQIRYQHHDRLIVILELRLPFKTDTLKIVTEQVPNRLCCHQCNRCHVCFKHLRWCSTTPLMKIKIYSLFLTPLDDVPSQPAPFSHRFVALKSNPPPCDTFSIHTREVLGGSDKSSHDFYWIIIDLIELSNRFWYVCVFSGRFGKVHKCTENKTGMRLAAKIINTRNAKERVSTPACLKINLFSTKTSFPAFLTCFFCRTWRWMRSRSWTSSATPTFFNSTKLLRSRIKSCWYWSCELFYVKHTCSTQARVKIRLTILHFTFIIDNIAF